MIHPKIEVPELADEKDYAWDILGDWILFGVNPLKEGESFNAILTFNTWNEAEIYLPEHIAAGYGIDEISTPRRVGEIGTNEGGEGAIVFSLVSIEGPLAFEIKLLPGLLEILARDFKANEILFFFRGGRSGEYYDKKYPLDRNRRRR